jgi:sugar phosphate isomerase/epimerase
MENTISAFTKPWPQLEVAKLADFLASAGFTGVELCVREGYQVYSPDNLEKSLKHAVSVFESVGVQVVGIGGTVDERTIMACSGAGIPFIRTLMSLPRNVSIDISLDKSKKSISEMIPVAERNHVIIGVQEHVDTYAFNTLLLYQLLQEFNSSYVRGIWDSAQSLMAGENADFGLGFILPSCCSVHLKNLRFTNPGVSFVSGREGIISWGDTLKMLKNAGYGGNITLTHEYSNPSNIEDLFREDCRYCRKLMLEECV